MLHRFRLSSTPVVFICTAVSELRSVVSVKVEMAALGSPSLIDLMVPVDEKQHKRTEFRSCVKVEVVVLGSPSLIILMVSVDVSQH